MVEAHKKNIYVVIDEGLWYVQLSYPKEIAYPNVIRLVSPSKKYGIPGMKIGVLIADKSFIKDYYEEASSGYGGPASIFFLLTEFLMLFEYVWISKDEAAFNQICDTYPDITLSKVKQLYADYCSCIEDNFRLFQDNRSELEAWGRKNEFVEKIHLLGGLNFFVKFNSEYKSMYSLFEDLVHKHKTSVMPSVCFGDSKDEYVRISILEDRDQIISGLSAIDNLLASPVGRG